MELFEGTQIEKDLSRMEDLLQEAIQAGNPELSRMSGHIIFSGGKRIRPALGMTVFRANSGQAVEELLPITVALELIHTATLIHDDIIDNATQRRGAPSVYKMFGKGKALVTGDFLFAKAFGMCAPYGPEVINIASQACLGLAEGEVMQMSTPLKSITTRKYMTIIKKKTADLFSAGTRIASMLARSPQQRVESMEVYGQHIGLAFQLVDDLLDLTGGDIMGKPQGTDIKEGKPTLAVIRARDQLGRQKQKQLIGIYEKKRRTKADINKVIKLVESTDGVDHARRKAKALLNEALKELDQLQDSEYKDLLSSVSRFIVDREL